MGQEDGAKFFPFPNVDLIENQGIRYKVPLEFEIREPNEWLDENLVRNKIVESRKNLEPRYISDEKNIAIFGPDNKKWNNIHAIKNEENFNYIYKVWLQRLTEEVAAGKRSPRLLRLESMGDEQERAIEVWNYLSQTLCDQLTNFCKNTKIGTPFNDVLLLSEALKDANSFEDNYFSILYSMSKKSIQLLFSLSRETKINWRAGFRKMTRREVNEWFDRRSDISIQSKDFSNKPQLIDYIMNNIISDDDELDDYNKKTRSLPRPKFISKLVRYVNRIISKEIKNIPNNHNLEQYKHYDRLVNKINQNKPSFGQKNASGNNNPKWKTDLDWQIQRVSEKLALQILKILTYHLSWVELEKGSDFDVEFHYDEETAADMLKDNKKPTMVYFRKSLFDCIRKNKLGENVSKSRKDSELYNDELHRFEPHAIIRYFEKSTRYWMYCQPMKHIIDKKSVNGGSILVNKRESLSNPTSDSLRNHKIKRKWPTNKTRVSWKKHWPQKALIGQNVCDALNNLQNTQWEINLDLLNLITNGFKITNHEVEINHDNAMINLKDIVEARFEGNPAVIEKLPKYRRKEINKYKKLKIKELQDSLKSIFKIIRNGDNVFWLRWVIDFRGRLYCHSKLGPHGGDFSKGIIRFKEWKILGESGWKWVKVYVCNLLSGIDLVDFFKMESVNLSWDFDKNKNKESFDSRAEWTENHIDSILFISETLRNIFDKKDVGISEDSKENLLKLMGICVEDLIKPKTEIFQRLAAILEMERLVIEYRQKLNWNKIKSGLPIHFDASCNGFQHAAALLRDKELAKTVNLLKPKKEDQASEDLYSEVANHAKYEFQNGNNSNLRMYLEAQKRVLGVNNKDIKEFGNIFTRDLVKRPTIAKGYGMNDDLKIRNGIISWKNDSVPPKVVIRDSDWEHYLSKHKIKNKKIIKCQFCVNSKRYDNPEVLKKHIEREHKVEIWHVESPLYKNIKSDKIRKYIESGEWCSEIQIEIAKAVADDVKSAIKEVTNDSFGTLGGKKLNRVKDKILKSEPNVPELRLLLGLEPSDPKQKKDALIKAVTDQNIEIENNLVSWEVIDSNGLKITYVKENRHDMKPITSTPKEPALTKYLVDAHRRLEPEQTDLTFEEILETWDIFPTSEAKPPKMLAKKLLRKLINKPIIEYSDYDLLSKIFDIAHKIEIHREEDTILKEIKGGLTSNFVHSLDACHMRNVINSMANKGVGDFWSVHDDFGTHAANIDIMLASIKEEFVNLHDGRNINWWCSQILNTSVENLPIDEHGNFESDDIGDFDVKMMLESEFFVS